MFLLPEGRSNLKLPIHVDYFAYCVNWCVGVPSNVGGGVLSMAGGGT